MYKLELELMLDLDVIMVMLLVPMPMPMPSVLQTTIVVDTHHLKQYEGWWCCWSPLNKRKLSNALELLFGHQPTI